MIFVSSVTPGKTMNVMKNTKVKATKNYQAYKKLSFSMIKKVLKGERGTI
jgi:hypothetical protein